MREILLPWDQQPQEAAGVDWGNPITRDLFFAWNAATDRDEVSGKTGGGSAPEKRPSTRGLYGVGNGTAYSAFPDHVVRSGDLSVFCLFIPTASDYQEIFPATIGKGYSTRQSIALYQAGGNIYFGLNGSGSLNRPYVAGAVNSAVMSIRAGVSNGSFFIVNDGAETVGTYNLAALTGPQDVEVLRNVSDLAKTQSGGVVLSYAWQRAITVEEGRALHLGAYRLLARQPFGVPRASAAPAVPNITFVGAENITATSADWRVTLDYA